MEAEIRKGGKKRGEGETAGGGRRRNGGGGGGGPGGHAGDEGEELVMVMRRCNDSSAVRSELALSFPLFFSSFSLSILFASLDSLPSLCLRMAMIPGTAYAPFYALLFTGTWLLSAQPRNLRCTTMYVERSRAHTSHNGTAAHFKHGK